MARTVGVFNRSSTWSILQNPTRFPYSCQAQFGMSGSGEPPAGGVSTVRGIGSRGFHSSTLTITQTARRAPSGSRSAGRVVMGEYAIRSCGNMATLLKLEKGSIYAIQPGGDDDFHGMLTNFDRHGGGDNVCRSFYHAARSDVRQRRASAAARLLARGDYRGGQ